MKPTFRFLICLSVGILACAALLNSQTVAIGTPAFNSFGGGPFDVVNLGNLNVHASIPIRHKAGRVTSFAYDLVYESSIWTPLSGNWIPVTSLSSGKQIYWGWVGRSNAASGSPNVTYSMTYTTSMCGQFGNQPVQQWQFSNFVYHDELGLSHQFGNVGGTIYNSPGGTACPPNGTFPPGTQNGTTSDSSGYKAYINIYQGYASGYVTSKDGRTIYPTFASNPPTQQTSYYAFDANGNKITVSSGAYTDTLGQTALTVAGSAPNNTTLTYTPPAGGNAIYTVSYKGYTVKTAFQCSGINDYTSSSTVYLVDKITLPDSTYYQLAYESTPGYNDGVHVTARIAKVTLPTGGNVQYQYTGTHNGINCSDGSAAGLTRTVGTSGPQWTYARTQGSGNAWTTTVTDPNNNQTVIQFQKDSASPYTTYSFYETERQVYQGATVLSTTINCYNTANPTPSGCTGASVSSPISRVTTFSYLPDTSGKVAETDTQYDTNSGNQTEVDSYDFGSGTPPSTPIRKVIATYSTFGSAVLPTSITTKDANNAVKAYTTLSYDQTTPTVLSGTLQHISNINSGNVTTISQQVSGSVTLYRKFTYYDTGMLRTATDWGTSSTGGPNVTTYNYPDSTSTCSNAFATSVTLPILGTTPSSTFNCVGGVATQTKDLNGNPTNIAYTDSFFWRPASISYPDGGQDSFSYVASPTSVTKTSKINATSNLVSTTVYDNFGRVSATKLTSDPAGTDEVDTTYDNLGRVASVSNSYRSTTDPTYGLTQYSYDALNRVTKITNPDNTTIQTTYTKAAVQTQNEAGRTKISQMDGLGRLISVCEVTNVSQMGTAPGACGQDIAATGFLTTYGYDVLSNLTGVTQSSETRSYGYDMMSRLTSESNPESGTTSYAYDTCSAGDVCSRTRPAPNQTGTGTVTASYSYDALHRPTLISYNDGTTPTVHRAYDTSAGWGVTQANLAGRLSQAWVISGSTMQASSIFGYDPLGRITVNNQCNLRNCGTGQFVVNYAYDLLGNETSATNGMGVTFGLNYNSAAQLTSYTSSLLDSSHPSTLVSGIQYNALGAPTSDTLGNGMANSWTYDHLGRVTARGSSHGSTYYGFGNGMTWTGSELRSAGDAVNGDWNFSYDDFGRLSTASCTSTICGNAAFSYAYDRFGNRWQQNLTAGSGPQPQYSFDSRNHMVGFSYDSAGNLLNDGVHSYSYDAENRLIKVDSGSTATYVYDAFGHRVQSGGENWIYDLWGNRVTGVNNSGGWDVGEVYVGSSHLATYVNGTTYFPLTDWLGTTRMITDMNAANAESCLNLPFGDGRNCSGSAYHPIQFTGLINDSETSLDHTRFRQYSATQGHWITPDPAGLGAVDPANPQSWNRYGYVLNNPMAFIDPSGLDCSQVIGSDGAWVPGCDPSSPTGEYHGTHYGPSCSGWCPGSNGGAVWNEPNDPYAMMNAAEANFLASRTVPWFRVVGGNLMLLTGSSIVYDEDDGDYEAGAWVKTSTWTDLGPMFAVNHLPGVSVGYTVNVIASFFYGVGPAFTYTKMPSLHLTCLGGGLGASAGHNFSFGPTVVSTADAKNILASWSFSAGYNITPWLGGGGSGNSSGAATGNTFGVPGAGAAVTWSKCWGGG